MSQPYGYSRFTPADSTGKRLAYTRSAYSNIRYRLAYDRTIVLAEADVANLPGLAYKYYGETSLWHAILAYNGLYDPLTDIAPGVSLRLFTKSSLLAYLSEQQNNNVNRTIRI